MHPDRHQKSIMTWWPEGFDSRCDDRRGLPYENTFKKPNLDPRSPTMKLVSIPLVCLSFAILPVARAQGLVEVTASRSLTIQPSGPRTGEGGSKYFNIEGTG